MQHDQTPGVGLGVVVGTVGLGRGAAERGFVFFDELDVQAEAEQVVAAQDPARVRCCHAGALVVADQGYPVVPGGGAGKPASGGAAC